MISKGAKKNAFGILLKLVSSLYNVNNRPFACKKTSRLKIQKNEQSVFCAPLRLRVFAFSIYSKLFP